MGFAILRTQKLKSAQAVRRSMTHAFREQETPNADPTKLDDNTHIGAANVADALERFNARLPDKVRKNAVLAIEYLVTASPEDMQGKSRAEQDAYFEDALKWLRVRHGAENVVYAGIHRDETTPHMYAYVVPLDERGNLNCRAFLGGPKALNEMQTDFAERVGRQHELGRGIEGSKAHHVTIQRYYARANAAFEPLPQVTTPEPKLRAEPEKPGLFAGGDAKEAYRADHAAWERERAAAEQQQAKRNEEIKAQRDAAVATAMRHEAQAKELAGLRKQHTEVKRSNSHLVRQVAKLEIELAAAKQVAELFTPDEIRAAQERRQQQDAERARQEEIARQRAAEAAQRAKIERERERRVTELPKLLKGAGAAYIFAAKATAALKEAGNDPSKVDWRAVEVLTAREAMGKHGQPPERVVEALTRHSPGRADPKTHEEIRKAVERNAPALRAEYEQAQRDRPRDIGREPGH